MSACGDEPLEPLNLTSPAVDDFVTGLYQEITQLFPDEWIHVGGDEVAMDWGECPLLIPSNQKESLQIFEQNLLDTVKSLDKRPMAWQDLLDLGVDLPKDVVLDVWKEWIMSDSLHKTTDAGHDVVFSACWYLDHTDEDWWKLYQCDPRGFGLSSEQQQKVLGGHASMWGEQVDATNFFGRVWPRASSMAEVLWSGSPPGTVERGPVQDRLARFRCFMVQQFDIPASAVQPDYCDGVDMQYLQGNTNNDDPHHNMSNSSPNSFWAILLLSVVNVSLLAAYIVRYHLRRYAYKGLGTLEEESNAGREVQAVALSASRHEDSAGSFA